MKSRFWGTDKNIILCYFTAERLNTCGKILTHQMENTDAKLFFEQFISSQATVLRVELSDNLFCSLKTSVYSTFVSTWKPSTNCDLFLLIQACSDWYFKNFFWTVPSSLNFWCHSQFVFFLLCERPVNLSEMSMSKSVLSAWQKCCTEDYFGKVCFH